MQMVPPFYWVCIVFCHHFVFSVIIEYSSICDFELYDCEMPDARLPDTVPNLNYCWFKKFLLWFSEFESGNIILFILSYF